MIRPIILVGMNRTGTKWLSNIISRHEDVIAVQSRRTNGIMETNMFSALPDKFDLSYPDEYIGLIELWAATHFFRRTGIDKELFYRLSPRPSSGLQLFEILMNEYARRNQKGHWLQKTTPRSAQKVLKYFTHARVVVIRRNLRDTVRSTLGLQSFSGRRSLFRATWTYVYQRKLLDQLCRHYHAVEMDYDRLKADPAREEARLFDELGLDRDNLAQEDAFPRSTTFQSAKQRQEILSRRAWFAVKVLAGAVWLIPLPVLSAGIEIRGWFRRRRLVARLVADTFGELGDGLVDRTGGPVRRPNQSNSEPSSAVRRSSSVQSAE